MGGNGRVKTIRRGGKDWSDGRQRKDRRAGKGGMIGKPIPWMGWMRVSGGKRMACNHHCFRIGRHGEE